MNKARRDFLRIAGGVIGLTTVASSPFFAPVILDPNTWNSEGELERKLLTEFIDPPKKNFWGNPKDNSIGRDEVSSILYDIEGNYNDKTGGDTNGRAIHIGDGYFLTSNHIVKGGVEQRLIPQHRRGFVLDFDKGFRVLDKSEEDDIALLKAEGFSRTGRPTVYLSPSELDEKDRVSLFARYTGLRLGKSEKVVVPLIGQDFYGRGDKAKLGEIIQHENSLLSERRGFVLPYDKAYFIRNDKKLLRDHSVLTTLIAWRGYSGSGVFKQSGENQYMLTGVLRGVYPGRYTVSTPNHPEGHRAIQQNSGVFVDNAAVRNLIIHYLGNKPKS